MKHEIDVSNVGFNWSAIEFPQTSSSVFTTGYEGTENMFYFLICQNPPYALLFCFGFSIHMVYLFRETCSPNVLCYKQSGVRFLDCFMKLV